MNDDEKRVGGAHGASHSSVDRSVIIWGIRMPHRINSLLSGVSRTALGAAFAMTLLVAPAAAGEPKTFNIPVQEATTAIRVFGQQAGIQVLATVDDLRGKRVNAVAGKLDVQDALRQMLAGTGLAFRATDENTILIEKPRAAAYATPEPAQAPASSSQGDATKDQPAEKSDDSKVEKVTVTGSRIRGATPASPVTVIDKDQIDSSGYGSTRDVLRTLPQNFNGGVNEFGNNIPGTPSNVSYASSVNLRGLGSEATLTLINGHRIPLADQNSIVDISMIPLSAIQRVEVLTDGASAIYGADAVAGVVNFILRRDFDGAETLFQYGGTASRGSLQEVRFAQTLGRSWDAGSALVSYEHYERDPLDVKDRSYSSATRSPYNLLSGQERDSGVGIFSLDLSSDVTAFFEALYGAQEHTVNTNFGSFVTATTLETKQLSLTGGLDWRVSESWDARLVGGYGQGDVDQHGVLGPPINRVSDGAVDTSLNYLEVHSDGELLDLPSGTIKAAIGAAFRREELGVTSNLGGSGAREVTSAFAEFLIPLIATDDLSRTQLELSVAGRYDSYSDFGATTNPKLGIVWRPASELKFRGTWGKSFRAPSLDNLYKGDAAVILNAPDAAAADGTSLTLLRLGANPTLTPETSTAWTVGADFVSDDPAGLRLHATYFDIDYRDRIQVPFSGNIFAIFADPTIAGFADRSPLAADVSALVSGSSQFFNLYGPFVPTDIEVIFDLRFQNVASSQVRGVDLSADYSWPLQAGEFTLGGSATYVIDNTFQALSTTAEKDRVDTLFHTPAWRARSYAMWRGETLAATAFLNYTGSYTNDTVTPNKPIESWTTVDVNLTYTIKITDDVGTTRLSLSVQNLFDTDPPLVSSAPFTTGGAQFGFDPTNASPIGRFISLQLTQVW